MNADPALVRYPHTSLARYIEIDPQADGSLRAPSPLAEVDQQRAGQPVLLLDQRPDPFGVLRTEDLGASGNGGADWLAASGTRGNRYGRVAPDPLDLRRRRPRPHTE